jgi:hypothetical protein
VTLAKLALSVHKARKAKSAPLVLKVLKDSRATRVTLVKLALSVHKARKAKSAQLALRVRKA